MTTAASARDWTRYVRFSSTPGSEDAEYGQPVDDSLDVGLALSQGKPVEVFPLTGRDLPFDGKVDRSTTKRIGHLLSPVSRSQLGGPIRCLGINFRKHVEEAGLELPKVPVMFMKGPHALSGPGDLYVPKFVYAAEKPQLDFEAELAVVISRDARDVPREQAMEYVLGFTSANDVTARLEQFKQSQWNFGKGIDNFCPLGPCLASPDSFDPFSVESKGTLNGEVMQQGNTSDHIFDARATIAYLSQGTTLPKGSVILLGTPEGIGWFREPQKLMKEGDTFTVWHAGPIGSLINTIRYEK
ncbi:hypothetical protein FA10DRAFT_267684 [Acaromyces ingoldii]|uniref:Fumarylacetoacetase-like C-terminal domain-containing protein n=1 Tax=Acaromyces ingoldii TaxID=215250 RepID=A0A316YIP7_9BASI|nr:hypothetical protein FA10DRAFT_267684 [Acaromyces ingoldii]PWN89079.1 hypothetical protein FA10DRAFT_267684 [Acaromyces ingoldii]